MRDKKLAKYRYMGVPLFPERFNQHDALARYDSYEEALRKVEEGLAAGSRHGFTSIMCAPKSILQALEEAAGIAPDS